MAKGSGLPPSCWRRGFGSKVSTWLGPPDIKRKMIRLARGSKGGGFTAKGLKESDAIPNARASWANKPARPIMPKPLAKYRNKSRRVRGTEVKLGSIMHLPFG